MEAAKAVLVTGASSGIGRKIVERLVANNHLVYAAARSYSDLCALNTLKNVTAVRLDVADTRSIAAALEEITMRGLGLYGLVNNAGIFSLGPVVGGDEAEFDLVMKVNAYGIFHVTKAFAPLIIAAKGRITTIGSLQGILAYENASAYSMSKHAVEAFTDSLATELKRLEVHVSIVESSSRNTPIATNTRKRTGSDVPLPDFSQYRDPGDVVDAVVMALFEPQPRRRYLVVQNQDEARKTIAKQIEMLVELNEGHAYTYDRASLIAMLDAALLQSQPNQRL